MMQLAGRGPSADSGNWHRRQPSMQLARQQGRHSKRGIRAKRFEVDTDFTNSHACLLGRKGTELYNFGVYTTFSLLLSASSQISTLCFLSLFTLSCLLWHMGSTGFGLKMSKYWARYGTRYEYHTYVYESFHANV